MDYTVEPNKTLEIIERMKLAKIGEYDKWEDIIKKIRNEKSLSPEEIEYFTRITRIYKESKVISRTKIYHTKLSDQDKKPTCKMCAEPSLYYCNMNDEYFCPIHLVGHDENEI